MKSHLKFKKKYKFPFELLSDEKVTVQKKYGVWGMKSFMGKKFMGTIRSTLAIKQRKNFENVVKCKSKRTCTRSS